MVEKASTGDGINRPYHYGGFRTDKPASAGYSAELIGKAVNPKFYDDLAAQPEQNDGNPTLLANFKRNVRENGDDPFLGTRKRLPDDEAGKPVFGDYEWTTNKQADEKCQTFA